MELHTIGDSHAIKGWRRVRVSGVHIFTHHLGPRLMHSFGRDRSYLFGQFLPKDVIVFCFGEIDVRCHLHRFGSKYASEINRLALSYFEAIDHNLNLLDPIKSCVYSIPPPVRKNLVKENRLYPFNGSDEERKEYTLTMNQKLRELCSTYGHLFFDVYNICCDEEGYLNMAVSDGYMHIHRAAPIAQFIRANIRPANWKQEISD